MPSPEKQLPPDARDATTRMRQGKTLGVMRWVLGASLLMVVVGFLVAFVIAR
ncbi:hypothetical protein GXW78_09825 [Roseomonas terrae]|uniref:Peptide ABC transporter permease n=1 Tax=Neoroseomonas terrae TaxID=424799 RepID=A0ABS5EG14_9PROT|nr:hypothetical protein [Neoroseomonas terrae]MBR0649961.1 hypothetical protein [Neoroseomonas terrae]